MMDLVRELPGNWQQQAREYDAYQDEHETLERLLFRASANTLRYCAAQLSLAVTTQEALAALEEKPCSP